MEFESIEITKSAKLKVVRYAAEENRLADAIAKLSESSPEQVISEIVAICHETVELDFYQKLQELFVDVVFIRQGVTERFAYVESKK